MNYADILDPIYQLSNEDGMQILDDVFAEAISEDRS